MVTEKQLADYRARAHADLAAELEDNLDHVRIYGIERKTEETQ